MEWLTNHLGEAILALLGSVGGLSAIVQVSPIKVYPWTWIAKKIGRAINGEVLEKVNTISQELSEHVKQDDIREAKRQRGKIIDFADELRQGVQHSEENFNRILESITEYNRFCAKHPEFPNDKATLSISYIETVYRKRLEENDFL